MAGVAEVGGAEAKEDGDGAAVAALVLQVVGAVLRTHLRRGRIFHHFLVRRNLALLFGLHSFAVTDNVKNVSVRDVDF